jgi:polyvinyl alcohol dehydrogenase (cytochrome)
LLGVVLAVAMAAPVGANTDAAPAARQWDWPSYGHDAQHSFNGMTTLTESSVASLKQAWFLPTGDAVTATPTVVNGTIYAGSWDGYFYAVDLRSGSPRWKYRLNPQPAVTPYPGETSRDITSDGGLVTSSAWFQPAGHGHPDLVVFGGGYTLYALNAHSGSLFWSHEYTGRPDLPPDPIHDDTRIFSSPVVSDGKVIFGVSVDGQRGRRGYVAAADLLTGNPVWELQTDVNIQGQLLNDGCGSVWSSGTLLPREGWVVFDTADCHGSNTAPFSESVLALSVNTGQVVWQYRPQRSDSRCDLDFGATANARLGPRAEASFLGLGGKNGTYYSLDPATGQLRWSTNVVFGGRAGGFIGTTAYDGARVYGSTALGDVPPPVCDPSNPVDTPLQEPSVHAFDGFTGQVAWQETDGASFSPTTVAGGMTFNSVALRPVVDVRDSATGDLLAQLPLAIPSWSGVATVGNAVVVGMGTSYAGTPAGIAVFTPDGVPPSVPPGAADD